MNIHTSEEMAMPTYPRAHRNTRKQRRRKKHYRKQQQQRETNNQSPKTLPMPIQQPKDHDMDDDQALATSPQVLLWQSSTTKRRSSSSGSVRSNSNDNDLSDSDEAEEEEQEPVVIALARSRDDDEEERGGGGASTTSSAKDIFRQPAYDRQAPSSSATSSELMVEQLVGDALVVDDDEEEQVVVDLMAPSGPQWFQFAYWKQLVTSNCCLPRRGSSSGNSATSMRRPMLDYRPTYMGYTADQQGPWMSSQQQQTPPPYYAMPWPQQQQQQQQPTHPLVSPMTEASFAYHHQHPYSHHPHQHQQPWQPHHQSNNASSRPTHPFFSPTSPRTSHIQELSPDQQIHELSQDQRLLEDLFSPIAAADTTNNVNEMVRQRHVRTASTSLPPPECNLMPFDGMRTSGADAQSVSSLESFQSDYYQYQNWNKNNSNSAASSPAQQPRMMVIPGQTMNTEGGGTTVFSNRMSKLRTRSPSPRPTSNNNGNNSKPPVAPPRRSSGGLPLMPTPKQHRAQATNSTMASTALPPLPSPPTTTQPQQMYYGTTPPALPTPPLLQNPPSRDLTRSFSEASAATNGSRHRRGGTVCEFSFDSGSLPLEVVQVYPPESSSTNMRSSAVTPSRWRLDSNGDDSLVFLDKQPQPTPMATTTSSARQRDDSEETGYISPLEEEQFLNSNSERPNSGESSNPQDSLCGDDDNEHDFGDDCDSVVLADTSSPSRKKLLPAEACESATSSSPFAKLRDKNSPPISTAGESWMWQWVNQQQQQDASAAAVTPTQSPSKSSTCSTSRSSVIGRRRTKPPMSPQSLQQQQPKEEKVRLEYLPKNPALEQVWRNKHATSGSDGIAVSGWVAFGLGDSLVEKLTTDTDDDNKLLDGGDIAYIIAPSALEDDKLWVSSNDNGTFEDLVVNWKDCRVEVREISRRHGRAVFVKRGDDETVCTLLPVCLPEHYNGSRQHFDPRQCFPSGDYLPDEQQYTTMHIMFALDSLLKANQAWAF